MEENLHDKTQEENQGRAEEPIYLQTIPHFKRLVEIAKERGFFSALDYDYQITRAYNGVLNFLFEGIDYLKRPAAVVVRENDRINISRYYDATYSHSGKLLELVLK